MATSTFGTKRFWIGMTRNSQDAFQWADGAAVSYVHWAPNEPSEEWNGNVENCVDVYDQGKFRINFSKTVFFGFSNTFTLTKIKLESEF